jgi:GAF domain-containing protein
MKGAEQMEPTPESARVLEDLDRHGEGQVAELLERAASRVRRLVPDCWGLSLSVLDADLTLTLVASSAEVARLDAVQYVTDGPCVRAIRESRRIVIDEVPESGDALGEEAWRLFTSASAAAGVRSTLSFPLTSGEKVVGGVNLYAVSPRAFSGHEDQVAAVFGAWAQDAIHDADLSFVSRSRAETGPERLAASSVIDQATGVLMARRGLPADQAGAALRQAAERAGVPPLALAKTILAALEQRRAGRGERDRT